MSEELTFAGLVSAIESADRQLRQQAKVAVNISLTLRNWTIGSYIAGYELHGGDRAEYGEELLASLARSLKELGVQTAGHRQLYGYLAFYRTYPDILRTVSAKSLNQLQCESLPQILRTLSAKSTPEGPARLVYLLSYSHLEQLVCTTGQVAGILARTWPRLLL